MNEIPRQHFREREYKPRPGQFSRNAEGAYDTKSQTQLKKHGVGNKKKHGVGIKKNQHETVKDKLFKGNFIWEEYVRKKKQTV